MPILISQNLCGDFCNNIGHNQTQWVQQEVYSITSSARVSMVGGTIRPSVLALLRLMTRSNLVGRSTGNSLTVADPPHTAIPLRPRCDRPRRRPAEKREEVATFHSITSSAMARSKGGTARPSALAVLRFTTISNFVGN